MISFSTTSKAFSLVELSIVLVILGLLVGGVLSGQSLIHAAQLRAVTEEATKYMSAVNSFRDKYFALPGDMTNATAFWGSAGGTGSDTTCQSTRGTGTTATCNGNGDGLIDTSVVGDDEQSRAWQHLANAGLVEGSYVGVIGPTPTVNVNMPGSKVGAAGWALYSVAGTTSDSAGSAILFPGHYGNSLVLLNMGASGGHPTFSPIPLTPTDEWNIDTKMDDGNPATGSVLGDKGSITKQCTTLGGAAVDAQQDADAQYNLSLTTNVCSYLYFMHII